MLSLSQTNAPAPNQYTNLTSQMMSQAPDVIPGPQPNFAQAQSIMFSKASERHLRCQLAMFQKLIEKLVHENLMMQKELNDSKKPTPKRIIKENMEVKKQLQDQNMALSKQELQKIQLEYRNQLQDKQITQLMDQLELLRGENLEIMRQSQEKQQELELSLFNSKINESQISNNELVKRNNKLSKRVKELENEVKDLKQENEILIGEEIRKLLV